MTLRRFEHKTAASVKDAVSLLSARPGKAVAIAGGTDLLGALKDGIRPDYPVLVVDIKRIPGLAGVRGRRVSIGALTTLSDLAKDRLIREKYPLLAAAARSAASPQIRNAATVGGNLCQEPRCWYYRTPEDLFHCLRKGGEHCPALLGDHRYHSVFGAARVSPPACSSACPGHVEIPAYLERVRSGDFTGAARALLERNPMPAVTGRVCPHRCEGACNRRGLDEAVAIREIERRVGSHIIENAGELMKAPAAPTRGSAVPTRGPGARGAKRVAVVGSGPAGLSAAYYLRKAGRAVTVFERMPEPGGMLAYGIPPFRLPPGVLRGQVEAYMGMGVEFRTSVTVGKDISLDRLTKEFDAVFVATGAWRAKDLDLPGGELLQSGLDLLRDVRLERLPAVGKRVLVIGGGNVAIDVAVTARRLGARSVTVVCLESRESMPAFPEDIERALAEGVKLMSGWGPKRVLVQGKAAGGLEVVRCISVFEPDGRFAPRFDPAVTREVDGDQVFLAIGQSPDLSFLGRGVKTGRGRILADPETGGTSRGGVFAGGDAVSGPASVIEAIAAGRKAAEAIDRCLGGARKVRAAGDGAPRWTAVNGEALCRIARVNAPEMPPAEPCLVGEDVATLGAEAARSEAWRCMDCACAAVNSSDLGPALIALGAVVKTTKRTIEAERFFDARPAGTTVLREGELVTAVELPAPRPRTRQGYLKFRLRQSIDFPILSVASVLELDGKRVARARIAFGAAGPVPLRATALEQFLAGKVLSEETAARAGEVAVQGASALPGNEYKLRVLKALVRKMLLTGEPD